MTRSFSLSLSPLARPPLADSITIVTLDCCVLADVPRPFSRPRMVSLPMSAKVLLMGQSNMSGRGLTYDPAIDGPNDPRIRQWSRANTIVTAREHLQHHDWQRLTEDKYVGMGTAFGRAYVETLPEQRDVLLVPTAHGGTALVNGPWSPGGYLFEDAMMRVDAALASGEGRQGNCVAAVLWHQGESDANRHVDQDAYQSAWTDMIGAVRDRVPGAAQAPAVLGEFSAPWVRSHQGMFGPVIAAIRAIPDSVAFTAVASADDLSVNEGTSIHFDSAGQREFGQRYFDKLGEAIGNDRIPARGVRIRGVEDTATQAFAAVA